MRPEAYNYPSVARVATGVRIEDVIADEVTRLGKSRALLCVAGSLADQPIISAVRQALGLLLAGEVVKRGTHIVDAEVIAAAELAGSLGADLIISIGGGTVTDFTKMIRLCASVEAHNSSALSEWEATPSMLLLPRPFGIGQIAVPTTLTGAEHNDFSGSAISDEVAKRYFAFRGLAADTVLYDPYLAAHTPLQLWRASGFRAIDHAVEAICSIAPNALVTAAGLAALRHLIDALPEANATGLDNAARAEAQVGSWLAAQGLGRVPFGASHGTGHLLLGLANVSHGVTSSLMLPATLRYNAPAISNPLAAVREATAIDDLPSYLNRLALKLELPVSLHAVGLSQDTLDSVANAMPEHFLIKTNPVAIGTPAEAWRLLEMAGALQEQTQ